jgi:hypothetical protein
VTGVTAILLDSDSAHALHKAYHAIKVGLNNTNFIDQFAPTVVRSEFLDEIRESLVLSPDSEESTAPGSVTASIAIAAASVSFVVASIFCYGIMRRDNRNSSEPHIRHKNRAYSRSALTIQNPMGIQKHRRHFVRLDGLDELPTSHSPTTFVTASYTNPRDYTPSITWSVSDITSDSCSIYSSLSRTTSVLERIEEEEEVEEPFAEDDEGNSENYFPRHFDESMTVPSYLYGRSSSSRIHVEDFDGAVFNEQAGVEFSELEGCRYLDDSPDDGYGEICHVITPIDLEDEMDDAVFMFIPDLQVMVYDDALIPDPEGGYEEADNFVPVEEVHEHTPYMTISTIEDDLEFSAEEDSMEYDFEDCEGDECIDVDPHVAEEEAPMQDESLGTFECSFHSAHSMVEPTQSETSCEVARKYSPTSVVEAKLDLQDGQPQAEADTGTDTSTLKHRDPEGDQPPAMESSDDDAWVGDDRNESKPNQDAKAEICNDSIEGGLHRDFPQVALENPENEIHPKPVETPKRRETSQDGHGLQDTSIGNYGTPMQEAPSPRADDEEEIDPIENGLHGDLPQVAPEKPENEVHPKPVETPKRRETSQDGHGLQDTSIGNYGTPMQEAPSPRADDEEEIDPIENGLHGDLRQVTPEKPENKKHPKAVETPKRHEKSQDGHGLQNTSIGNYGTSMQEAPAPRADDEEEVDATVVADSTNDNLKEWVAHMMEGLVETATEDTWAA